MGTIHKFQLHDRRLRGIFTTLNKFAIAFFALSGYHARNFWEKPSTWRRRNRTAQAGFRRFFENLKQAG